MSSCARPQQTINKIIRDVSARQEKKTRKGKGFAVRRQEIKTISYIAKTKLEFSFRTRTLNTSARQNGNKVRKDAQLRWRQNSNVLMCLKSVKPESTNPIIP